MESKIIYRIDPKATGARMKNLCENKNLKATDVQLFFGFNEPRMVFKWFRGDALPNLDNAINYCRLVDVEIDDLLVITEERRTSEKADMGENNTFACEITGESKAVEKPDTGENNTSACVIAEEISCGEIEAANSSAFESVTQECKCSAEEKTLIKQRGATVGIDPVATGNRLKKLMLKHKRSVKDVQKEFDFTHPTSVYAWRSGKSLPSLNSIVQLSKYLGVRISDILVTTDMCA